MAAIYRKSDSISRGDLIQFETTKPCAFLQRSPQQEERQEQQQQEQDK